MLPPSKLSGFLTVRRSIGRGTVEQGHGFARLMTVSARFRVKSDPTGLVDLTVFHILNTFVFEKTKKVNCLSIVYIYVFLIFYILRVSGSTQVHLTYRKIGNRKYEKIGYL